MSSTYFRFSKSSLACLVSMFALTGLGAKVARADDGLLTFNRVTPVVEQPPAPERLSSGEARQASAALKTAAPVASDKPRQAPAPKPKVVPVEGVSAVAYSKGSALTVESVRAARPVVGPSERDLQNIFRQAVETAVARSPAVLRSRGEQEAAESDIDQAKGQRWPQVDVGTQSRAKQFGNGENDEQGSGGVQVSVSTMLYDWGRVGNTIQSREKLATAASENLAAETENIGFEVVTTLAELGKQRVIGELSQTFANRMEELVKMLAGIVAADPGRASELTQAKARLLQAQVLRDAARAKAQDAEITLRKLVGDQPIPIPGQSEWNISLTNLERLLDAAQNHPTILQAAAQAESAELEAQAVRASGLPQLNWVVSKNTAEDYLGREQPWQTNLSMSWGAFRGGSTRAAERAALQRADASRQETAQQRRDLEFRIRSADNDARTQLERAELYRNLAVESDSIRQAFYLQWHHLGKRTLLDVLIAENDHYGNQVSEITNRFDGYQSIFRQYASAGVLAQWLQGKS